MGTTRRTTYRIECRTNDRNGQMVVGVDKKPKDMGKWCEDQEASERQGKPNEHCAIARGFLLAIHSARLIRQSDGEIVAWYKAAPFRAF
jgi:hypothetical protein